MRIITPAVVLAAVCIVLSACGSSAVPAGNVVGATEPAAADFPCGSASSGALSLTVCEYSSGEQGMTPMIARNDEGTLFMTVATTDSVIKLPDVLLSPPQTYMLRSRDDGRSWDKIALPAGIIASEAILSYDRVTDRLYALSMSYDLTHCGYPVAWTDDEGQTWSETEQRPGCIPPTLGDWPKLFTGPFPAGVAATGSYPNAVYSCNFVPNILVAASLMCWRSLDGGKTFGDPSILPALNGACIAADGSHFVHGNGPETIVHGTGTVLSDGTVVVPVNLCGRIIVMRSTDGAQTWSVHDTGSDGVGWFNWLANLGTQSGGDNVYNMMAQEEIAQDDAGNLFLAYPATGGVKLAYSSDGGISWQQRGIITTSEVAMPWLVSTTARGNGEVAISFMATPDHGDPLLGGGERFRNWIGYSPDAINQPFVSAATSPMSAPALVAGGIAGQTISCCANLQYFVEYTGVVFAGNNQIRAAFVRDQGDPNPVLTLGKASFTAP